jgi:hypothetical protein
LGDGKHRLPLLHEDIRSLLNGLDQSGKTWKSVFADMRWEWLLARHLKTLLWILTCGCLCRRHGPVRVAALTAEMNKWAEYTTKARRIASVRGTVLAAAA